MSNEQAASMTIVKCYVECVEGLLRIGEGGAEDFGGSGKERVTRGVRKVRTKDRRWRSVGGILTSLDGLSKDAGVCDGDVQAE